MMVSTKGRYALRIMIDLSRNRDGGFISLKEIARRQGISSKYMEAIVAVLVKAGYVEGLRGKGGGYRLTKAPGEYTVGSILKLTEGTLAPVACLECKPNHCERAEDCVTLPMWEKLDQMIDEYFEGITIAELINGDFRKP